MILAITGGTGFVGSHLIDHALETGHTVRALARKPQAKRIGVTWVEGALDRRKHDCAERSIVSATRCPPIIGSRDDDAR